MDIITREATRCLGCGSAARTKYHDTRRVPVSREGFTHLVIRRTTCSNCGRHRIERTYESHEGRGDRATPATRAVDR